MSMSSSSWLTLGWMALIEVYQRTHVIVALLVSFSQLTANAVSEYSHAFENTEAFPKASSSSHSSSGSGSGCSITSRDSQWNPSTTGARAHRATEGKEPYKNRRGVHIYIYIHTCRAENTQNLHVLESIGRRRLNINTDLQKQISWANQLFMSFWESVLTTPRAPGAAGAPQVPHLGAKAKTSTSADLHAAPEADPSRKNTN